MIKTRKWFAVTKILAALLAFMIPMTSMAFLYEANINRFLNIQTSRIENVDGAEQTDTLYYKSDFGNLENLTEEDVAALHAAEDAHIEKEAEEGSVLLRNEGKALPLEEKERSVTLLGHASFEDLYKPNSGGANALLDLDRTISLKEALDEVGFSVNETMYSAYAARNGKRANGQGRDMGGKNPYDTAEEEIGFYTEELRGSFASYGDAAIVVLARCGGETYDLPVSDRLGSDDGRSHLALLPAEEDLMQMVKGYKEDGTFGKVIVLLNSGYPMEVEWMDEYSVDACLWIGGPGMTGYRGVVDLLTGEENPSGRLVDTYAANSLSAPAVQNFGDFTFANADEIAAACKDPDANVTKYLVQAEGIYVGYKYYETRYEDIVLGRGNADGSAGVWESPNGAWDYAAEVSYPFGYGLSYTTFEQTLDSFEVKDKDTFSAAVTVTNTGDVAGKCVVQLYAQAPYIEGGIEKAAVQLVAFGKTDVLEPGRSGQVELEIDKYFLASYDPEASVDDEQGCYVLDEGTYYFAIGDDAHDALNNILAAKRGTDGLTDAFGDPVQPDAESTVRTWELAEKDDTSYRYSRETGARVSNRFEGLDINEYIPGSVVYLSRSDWQGTYPSPVTGLSATDEMIAEIDGYTYQKPADAPAVSDITLGAAAGINILTMRGLAYDDGSWETFLDQLTLDDMLTAVFDNSGNDAVESVGKKAQNNNDGPDGVATNITVKDERGRNKYYRSTAYANEVVLASAWNIELVRQRGYYLAEDCLFADMVNFWGPACNIHRTPFSGRNFEYYSEDANLSYIMAAEQVKVMREKGVVTSVKHLVANDQEKNRNGVSTFMTEQTLREIELRAFEGAFTKGGALSTMTSFNRIGCTLAPACSALQNGVLREEWGFNGMIITDWAGNNTYIHTLESLAEGTDVLLAAGLDRPTREPLITSAIESGDGYLLQRLREINHHFYYAFANSFLVNGLTSTSRVVEIVPWWQPTLIAFCCLLGAACLACGAVCIVGKVKEEKRKRAIKGGE